MQRRLGQQRLSFGFRLPCYEDKKEEQIRDELFVSENCMLVVAKVWAVDTELISLRDPVSSVEEQ